MVGTASFFLSIANLLCAIGLSDLKSLSIRHLVEERSLESLNELRNLFIIALAVIAIVGVFVPNCILLTEMIVLRACTQAADVNVSIWQKEQKARQIVIFSALRYAGVAAILFIVSEITKDFQLGLALAAAVSAAIFWGEQETLRRQNPDIGMTWRPLRAKEAIDMRLVGSYFSLSLAAGLNLFPQVLLRYQLILFGGLAVLGHFSIQYQISMLAVPLITALSQQALARCTTCWDDIAKDLMLIGGGAALLITVTTLVFLTPASVLVGLVFKSWSPLDFRSTILISIASICLCLTVYLGFMTVALHKPFAQTVANICFLCALLALGFGFGALWGGIGVLGGFAIATCLRLMLLQRIVWRSAKRDGG